jgi:hypothetical protein
MKPMTVTPETMQQDGQSLTQVAQEMASGLTGLQSTVQGDGNPWGSDEQGSLFGTAYQLVLGTAFEAITSHVEQVGYAGQALVAQAGGYDQVETGNSQQLRTLAPEG